MFKKILFMFLFALLGVNLFATNSDFSVSVSPLSFFSLASTEDDFFPNVSLSVNIGNGTYENDWFVVVNNNSFSLGYEGRNFRNYPRKGFFYGPYVSLDYRKIYMPDGDTIQFSTAKYDDEKTFTMVGLRLGVACGYRFLIKNTVGISPKIGLTAPLYYPIGLEKVSSNPYSSYLLASGTFCFVAGLKIDFM